jgi:SAM-dependent methyltransferase
VSVASLGDEATWHDVECGGYAGDLALWDRLAREAAGPVLELGCGTGRVALRLARSGLDVAGLDSSPGLLAELRRRAAAEGVEIDAFEGDARRFALEREFALVCAPMQLVHLLGGASGRRAMLERSAAHLRPGGAVAIALLGPIIEETELDHPPLPDVAEREGWIYSSQPLDVQAVGGGLEVRRLRQLVSPTGDLREQVDNVRLDLVGAAELEAEALGAGFEPRERIEVAPTADHVGSTVVVLERLR